MLIYIMLIFNQTNLYQQRLDGNISVLLVIMSIAFLWLMYNQKKIAIYSVGFSMIILYFVCFTRLLVGGIGLVFWVDIACKIAVTTVAIAVDTDNFLYRFVKVVTFFAMISLVFWVLCLLGKNIPVSIFQSFDNGNYRNDWSSGFPVRINYKGYGMLFYTFIDFYEKRNVGIFTEPGVYQAVLCSAMYILVFWGKKLGFSATKKWRYLIILIIAVISTQSTSGYMGLIAIFIGALFGTSNELKNDKKIILGIGLLGILALLIDYSIRGTDSFLNMAFLAKLFEDGTLNLASEGSTGKYRMATTIVAIQIMIQHPLGIGIDQFASTNFAENVLRTGTGGWPFKLGSIIGVIPFIITVVWLFLPLMYWKEEKDENENNKEDNKSMRIVIRRKKDKDNPKEKKDMKDIIAKGVFLFLYFNTSLAQTSAFYPALIMIPIYIVSNNLKETKSHEDDLYPVWLNKE